MQRNTHKNRTKLINNKRTSKRARTLKKRRVNKQRGGDITSNITDTINSIKKYAVDTKDAVADNVNVARIGTNKVAQNINDKFKNVTGDITSNANLLYNAVPSNLDNSTNRQKVLDALNVEPESQSEKVSDKEIITAVLDKYLNFLKEGIKTGETKESGKFVILLLSDKDKNKNLINEMISDRASYAPLWKEIGPSTKENLTKIQKNRLNINIQEILDDILYEFKEAEDIVNDITDKLQQPLITKKLSKKQIDQINQIIKNQPSMLSNVSKNIASGFEQFGSWLIPAVTTDMNGNPIKEHNQTKIHFLWYPRMHTKYNKGSSVGEKMNRYGDFMVYVEPEKYSSTAEYIVQSTDSVDDLLTNVLNGYQQSAVPEPYKHKIYTINNYQPFFNKPEVNTP